MISLLETSVSYPTPHPVFLLVDDNACAFQPIAIFDQEDQALAAYDHLTNTEVLTTTNSTGVTA